MLGVLGLRSRNSDMPDEVSGSKCFHGFGVGAGSIGVPLKGSIGSFKGICRGSSWTFRSALLT